MTNKAKSKKLFGVRVDPDLIKKIKHLSIDADKPIVSLVEEALKDLLGKYRRKA